VRLVGEIGRRGRHGRWYRPGVVKVARPVASASEVIRQRYYRGASAAIHRVRGRGWERHSRPADRRAPSPAHRFAGFEGTST